MAEDLKYSPAGHRGLITVFGGTGFLGRWIVRHLLDHGFRVRTASRHPERVGSASRGGADRLVPGAHASPDRSRWPTIGVFDSVASADDLEAALLLESLTDDRVNETLTRLGQLDRSEWLTGQPGAMLVMAAFCHPALGGGRFNGEALGAWYCATEIETAIAETGLSHTKRLAHSAGGFRHVIQMRELVSEVDAEVCDVRAVRESHSELYDPESYAASQPFGEALRRAGASGIVYASVRRPSGTNLVVYRPSLLPPVIEGDHFDYRWMGGPTPAVLKLTGVGGALTQV